MTNSTNFFRCNFHHNLLNFILTTDETTFNVSINETFSTTLSDGTRVELKENGSNIALTLENREEYIRLEEAYRLNEFNLQTDAIRRGLGTMVPVSLLSLFTWSELETMVCGSRDIDVDYLRRNTEYTGGIHANDKHIQFFWQALHSFSAQEKQDFIRYVWGQSRLPYNEEDFTMKFKIAPAASDNNGALPVSHTCFFTLDCPRYTSYEILREKLIYAMKNCMEIDADNQAEEVDWDAQ